jgi:hypothetical protein
VVVAVIEGSREIGGVELISLAESERSELSSLLDDGVQEANGEDNRSPLVIGLNLFEVILVDHGVECLE